MSVQGRTIAIVGGMIVGAAADPVLAGPVLNLIGFGTAGPTAGTLATVAHAYIGNVAAGSFFSSMQAAAMTGSIGLAGQALGAAAGGGAGWAGHALGNAVKGMINKSGQDDSGGKDRDKNSDDANRGSDDNGDADGDRQQVDTDANS